MKQLLSIFLFLLPCLAWAQYPSNGNQKITLGEQTTADGLIFRGVLADTGIITPLSDTSAYIILDTANHRFYNYNRATNVWSVAGGGVTTFSAGSTGLTPSTATSGAVTLGGTLAVANGGTGLNTLTANKIMVGNGTGVVNLPTNLHYDLSTNRLGIGTTTPRGAIDLQTGAMNIAATQGLALGLSASLPNGAAGIYHTTGNSSGFLEIFANEGGLYFSTATQRVLHISSSNLLGVGTGTSAATEKLHVVGNARFTAVGAGAYANDLNITSTGVLTTASSDEKYKYNILPINYGLNTILQLNPVNFQWIKGEENDLGFIAQDVAEIIPEAVDTNWNSDLLMRYESIIPILTKAIQEQNLLIKALEQRIINLENK